MKIQNQKKAALLLFLTFTACVVAFASTLDISTSPAETIGWRNSPVPEDLRGKDQWYVRAYQN